MVRQTSIEAYDQIKMSGLLSERRWNTYDMLFKHGPCTGMELLVAMKRSGLGVNAVVDSQVRARLNELRELGVAQEVGTRICSITKQKVILWDVTSGLPQGKVKSTRECPHCTKLLKALKTISEERVVQINGEALPNCPTYSAQIAANAIQAHGAH